MKKWMSVVSFMFCIAAAAQAQDTLKIFPYPDEQNDVLEKIAISDLPEGTKQSLRGGDYSGWKVIAAYKTSVSDANDPLDIDSVNYVVELKKNGNRKTLRFNEEGIRLKENGQ